MVRTFKKSAGHAWAGIAFAWRSERNFRIECVVALFVVAACFLLRFSYIELAVVFAAVASVLTA